MKVSINRWRYIGMAFVLLMALAMPLAHANQVNDRLPLREGNRSGNKQLQQQPRNPREAQRPQRLSPEERRQLRRDIKDAGREIYPARK